MNILLVYIFVAFLYAGILSCILEISLQSETDEQIIKLFDNKLVKNISVIILSIFWVITSVVVIYNNLTPEGDIHR